MKHIIADEEKKILKIFHIYFSPTKFPLKEIYERKRTQKRIGRQTQTTNEITNNNFSSENISLLLVKHS